MATQKIDDVEKQLLYPKGVKPISEVLPKIEFYPELPRSKWDTLVDCMIVIYDAKIIELAGDFGTHDAALIKYVLADDVKKEYTTITSGAVIVDKMARLLALQESGKEVFPVAGIVTRVKSDVKGHSAYYDLV